jgi:hypothetical protein
VICPQLKQNLEVIKTLKSELDLELPKLQELFKIFKNNNRDSNKKDRKELMNKIKSLQAEINVNIKIVQDLIPAKAISTISALSPEGKEVKFELNEELKYWSDFYKNNGIDWVSLPEKIKITREQQKEMERLVAEFGFNKMIVIPENLAATGANYEKLHTLMSKGYNDTYLSDIFKKDGHSFSRLKNKSDKLRIILTKDVKELDDDRLFKQTLDQAINDLEAEGGILTKNKLKGFDIATYLIYQREYFKRTRKHLDCDRSVLFPEQAALPKHTPYGGWSNFNDNLSINLADNRLPNFAYGCRLAGSFEIE